MTHLINVSRPLKYMSPINKHIKPSKEDKAFYVISKILFSFKILYMTSTLTKMSAKSLVQKPKIYSLSCAGTKRETQTVPHNLIMELE